MTQGLATCQRRRYEGAPPAAPMDISEPAAPRSRTTDHAVIYPLVVLVLFFAVLMIKTAWVGDDAFISFRPLDNLLNGYGLRWNIHERVQVYTDPLWLVLVFICYAVTGEIFVTTIVLSIVVSLSAVLLLVTRIRATYAAALAGLAALISSRAFVDYTTSGLENALNYLLVAVFCAVLFRQPVGLRQLRWLILVASLGVANRLDTALLFAPAIGYVAWVLWRRENVSIATLAKIAAIYSVPVTGWLLFSLIYFGYLFPNTYYAKLYTALPKDELLVQGILYYFNSLDNDPLTLLAIGFALALTLASRKPLVVACAVGICLYLLYIIKIGGDFMSGRFFSVPLFFAMALLVQLQLPRRVWFTLALVFVGIGLLARHPVILSDETFAAGTVWDLSGQLNPNSVIDHRGIADERAAYYPTAGLLPVLKHDGAMPTIKWVAEGLEARARGPHIAVSGAPGFYGFYAGPEVRVLDYYALGDPLLSKLPTSKRDGWRVGHYPRAIPDGYLESIQSGTNRIQNPKIRELYRVTKILAEGPIWSGERLKEIAKMNLGLYNRQIRSIKVEETGAPAEEGGRYPLTRP